MKGIRRWYEARYGALGVAQDLMLVCVWDPHDSTEEPRVMRYGPSQVFEAEHPWLSSEYDGPAFSSYFGTWYGAGSVAQDHVMDFELFYDVYPGWKPLPSWGMSWR